MVTYALFAESSRARTELGPLALRAALAIGVVGTPAMLILWAQGSVILRLFGAEYVNQPLLNTLLLSIIPFSINSIWFVVLRVRRQLRQIVLFSGFAAASILVLSAVLVQERGVDGLALGWLLGQAAAAVAALLGGLVLFVTEDRRARRD
jgi:O-antigen/teichoic acid export membrane protein